MASNANNPIIKGYYADPEILYSEQTGKYYLYPTTDGYEEWRNHDAYVYSSDDMKTWKCDGKVIDLRKDISWADERLWAPCIIERKYGEGKEAKYKYFYYFVADGNIGVATADHPTGPFHDALGKPMIPQPQDEPMRGHIIDPDVFHDPQSNKYYLYWGNSFLVAAELSDDMLSLKEETLRYIIPREQQHAYHYGEGSYVFYRKGKYYFMWSENDTRSPEYRVRYTISESPIEAKNPVNHTIVLQKDPSKQIYGTGHHAVICRPGTDEWYIVYHRFQRPDGLRRGWSAGYYREVCIDRLYFNEDGTIKTVEPTL
nr:family 43 glycosylhydrolase [Phocaeicola vulgatus]